MKGCLAAAVATLRDVHDDFACNNFRIKQLSLGFFKWSWAKKNCSTHKKTQLFTSAAQKVWDHINMLKSHCFNPKLKTNTFPTIKTQQNASKSKQKSPNLQQPGSLRRHIPRFGFWSPFPPPLVWCLGNPDRKSSSTSAAATWRWSDEKLTSWWFQPICK